MANTNNNPLWFCQTDKDGFAPLLSEEEGADDDHDAPLGTLELRPSQRYIPALVVLKNHRLTLDDTSLSILGGIFIRFQYFARDKHPAHGNSSCGWLGHLCFTFYVLGVVVLQGLLSKHLGEDSPWNYFTVALYIPPLFFNWEVFRRKSQVYQAALSKFHEEVLILVQELNDLLQPHGFCLEANQEPDKKTGNIEVQVRKTGMLQGSSLPPVSQEFLERAKPLTELDQGLVAYGVLAMGVPIDEWTLGQLLMRYRCLHKELHQDGRLVFWCKVMFGVYLLLSMAVDYGVFKYFAGLGDVDSVSIAGMFWWVPFVVLLWPLFAGLTHLTEWLSGGPIQKHQRYSEATALVSPLAVERHGMELAYNVGPGFCRTTKGMVQFVPIHDGQSEVHGASTPQPQLHVAVIV